MDVIRQGEAAERLLNDDLFKQVIEGLRNQSMLDWSRTSPEHSDAREDLYYLMVAISQFETRLKTMADNAKMEIARG